MNRCFFIGRVTKDIELKTTQNNKSYVRFSLAVDNGFGDNKKSSFFSMVAWNKSAEALAKFAGKGKKIAVECVAEQNQYTNRDGNKVNTVEFTVMGWEFCESKSASGNNAPAPQQTQQPQAQDDGFIQVPEDMDENLPFA